MIEEEMQVILDDSIKSKQENIEHYRELIQKISPDLMLSPKERFKKEFGDTEFYELFKDECSYMDYNDPTESFISQIFDYIYGDKEGLSEEEREFLKDFDRTIELISTCERALKIKTDKYDYLDIMSYYRDTRKLYLVNDTIVITDPCYLGDDINGNDNRGYELDSIYRSTLYGDWSCTVYNTDTNKEIGKFCADSGEVGVFKLKEIAKSYPKFLKSLEEHPHIATVINDFTGSVIIEVKFNKNNKEFYCYVKGEGNINFISKQTGF